MIWIKFQTSDVCAVICFSLNHLHDLTDNFTTEYGWDSLNSDVAGMTDNHQSKEHIYLFFFYYLCHQQISFSLFIKEQRLSFPLGLCWRGPVVWLFSRQGWEVQLGAVSLSWRTKESYFVPIWAHSGVFFILNHVKSINLKKIICLILNGQHQNPSKSLITVAYKK